MPINMVDSDTRTGIQNWKTPAWFFSLSIAFLGLFTANPFPSAIAALLPMALCSILWKVNQQPIVLFAAWMQALPVIATVIHVNRLNLSFASILPNNAYLFAFLYAAAGLLALAFGLRSGLLNSWPSRNDFFSSISKVNAKRVFRLYLVFLGLGFLVPYVAYQFPPLTQFILPLSVVRYFFAFILFLKLLLLKQDLSYSLFLIFLEVAVGFTGFFSGFKTIFFVFAGAALASSINPLQFFRPKVLSWFLLLVVLASYWQYIKPEFRGTLDQGTNTQSVRIGYADIARFHLDEVSQFNIKSFQLGLESGLERLAYLDYFASSINHVPLIVPHQNGRLWFEAIQFLMPRFLNPNKQLANDSERTNEFTGQRVAGVEQGTSISIGYFGESYIDFGFPLMLLPIVLLGWIWGRLFSLIALITPFTPLNIAASTLFLLSNATSFEGSNLKLLSGSIVYFITFFLFLKYFGVRFWRFLSPGSAS